MLQIEQEPKPGSNPVGHFDKKKAAQEKLSEQTKRAYKLKEFVDEIRKFDNEKLTITAALKAIYDAASAAGYNKKALQKVVKNKAFSQFSFSEFASEVQNLEADLAWVEKNPRWKKMI